MKSEPILETCQVAIVGGGPVGLGLAIELGQRGVKCCLIERRATPQLIPKGQNLTQRTMEHFHFWGAERLAGGAYDPTRLRHRRNDHLWQPARRLFL